MSVTVLVQLEAKPGCGDALLDLLRETLPELRGQPGCIEIRVVRDLDAPDTLIAIEKWQDRVRHEEAATRLSEATRARIGELRVAGPPPRYLSDCPDV